MVEIKHSCNQKNLAEVASTEILYGVDFTPGWGIQTSFLECPSCGRLFFRDIHHFTENVHPSGKPTKELEPPRPYQGILTREEIICLAGYHAGHLGSEEEIELRETLKIPEMTYAMYKQN